MVRRGRVGIALVASLVVIALMVPLGARGAPPPPPPSKPTADKVIFFSSDGMRPDLMEGYAAGGFMPTYADLLANGVRGDNGLVQAFPPNTGVGWTTLATGAYPGEHGSTNNTFHRTGGTFTSGTSFAATGIVQADTIQQAAERAGKTVVSMEWVASRSLVPALQGPVVDFRSFFSRRGIVLNFDLPGQPAGANAFGVDYQRVDLDDAKNWKSVPKSFSKAKQEQFTLTTTFSSANPTRVFDLYIYDSTNDKATNYDHVLVVPSTAGKVGTAQVADLEQGDWADVKVTINNPTRTAGFYIKAIDIAPDLSQFRLYFTSVARVNASYNALGPSGSDAFVETLASQFPTSTAADFAPLEAGIVDEDTYVEQGLMWADAHHAYMNYIMGTAPVPTVSGGTIPGLGVQPDLLMLGVPVTDEFSHQFMALVSPTDIDGTPNPYFDDATNDDVPDGRVSVREGYIRSAYQEADATLGLGRSLVNSTETVFATSDHGFAPQWFAVNARRVLFESTVDGISLQASGATATSNCGAATSDLTKACWAGGTAQIYVNPTLPSGTTYEEVRAAVVSAFSSLTDPGNPGATVVDEIFLKEDLRDVDGSDSLHPNRSGDVVVVTRPPYQYDAATGGVKIAFSQFFGQHGYMPDLVDLANNVNMHGTFVAAGPGVATSSTPVPGVRAVDLASTISFLLDIPGPQNARGKILYEVMAGASHLKEFTILDISDYHGQLVPLQEAADTVGPMFTIGGAAFLKPWFDVYRAEAQSGQHITVAGGDSIGATPPISSFFGDKPVPELMNMMGFDADGIGNHNFDKGEQYFRNEIVPLADFKYVSANILDSATNNTPEEWSKSVTFSFGGTKLGLVGFSNEDIPTLTFPGALGPFVVSSATDAVNQRAGQLRHESGMSAVVAIGHLGATAGTLTSPTGPLIDLADNVSMVDVVIGDHTDFQVLTTRSNGVLVTENRSKGLRFTRVRIVVDTTAQQVVYKTADFHKPWNIGVTADPAIQARIDELNAEIAPILNQVIGDSKKVIPRADQCGNGAGRTCESLEGNAVTDAIRATYSTDFAITNSGGLRADLTCPVTDNPNDTCPASLYPFAAGSFPITRGKVLEVLPFGNIVVTLTVNGAELKSMLENGVSLTGAQGRFPQVSGLCFTYNLGLPAGSRVLSAFRTDSAGNCTTTPVDLTAASSYTIAENDFMVNGGDGYPNFASRATTRDIMDQVVADYISANSPLNPFVNAPPNGRINCTDTVAPNDCPAVVASPPA
jgi:2',3'-cyclic-nucleotide 2'-phosphodiesterase (5'-nucleotidase family)